MSRRLGTSCVAVLAVALLSGADWRQFRGNDSDLAAKGTVGAISLEEPAWKVDLPGRGLSGPIVVGGRVFVTSCSGYDWDRLHVHCFDAKTGERIWERQFWATGRTMTHPKTSVAAPTPASDGARVFAFFSTNDLACLDLEGNLLWYRGLGIDHPNATNSLGMASSPVVAGETVVVQMETDDDSLALGLDVRTGLDRWSLERPAAANWTSPIPFESGGNSAVLLQSSKGMSAVDPATGDELWSYVEGASTISSSAVADGKIYIPSHGITVLRPTDGKAPESVWRVGKLSPATVTPVVHEGRVYIINSAGVVTCGSADDGRTLWQTRLKGPYFASPVVAGGRFYTFNEAGAAHVVELGDEKGEVVAEHDLGEPILSTPAVADGALYVRSDNHLWKFVAPE